MQENRRNYRFISAIYRIKETLNHLWWRLLPPFLRDAALEFRGNRTPIGSKVPCLRRPGIEIPAKSAFFIASLNKSGKLQAAWDKSAKSIMCVCAQAAGYAVWPAWRRPRARAECPVRFAAPGSKDCANRPADTNRHRLARAGAECVPNSCRTANRRRRNICRSPSRYARGFSEK